MYNFQSTSFLTTIIVNSKNWNKSIKSPLLPLGFQNSSQCVGESSDLSNFLSRANSRACKQIYSRERSQTCCIVKHFSRSIYVFSIFRIPSPKALALFFLGESKEKNISWDPKTPTPWMTIGKLSFNKISSLKLSTTFLISISKRKTYTMIWDD